MYSLKCLLTGAWHKRLHKAKTQERRPPAHRFTGSRLIRTLERKTRPKQWCVAQSPAAAFTASLFPVLVSPFCGLSYFGGRASGRGQDAASKRRSQAVLSIPTASWSRQSHGLLKALSLNMAPLWRIADATLTTHYTCMPNFTDTPAREPLPRATRAARVSALLWGNSASRLLPPMRSVVAKEAIYWGAATSCFAMLCCGCTPSIRRAHRS